jgi:hypothetical protein
MADSSGGLGHATTLHSFYFPSSEIVLALQK